MITEWISIKRKKPAHMKDVLLCNDEHEWVTVGYRNSKEYYNQMESKDNGDCNILPTHWMPLLGSAKPKSKNSKHY